MNQLLRIGQSVQIGGTLDYTIKAYIGGGGQGEVYRASQGEADYAVKWYFSSSGTPLQRSMVETAIQMGAPDARFLWPQAIVTSAHSAGFGYLMPLRAADYCGLLDLNMRHVTMAFRELATAGMQLADSFFNLHRKGLCYCDISFGNVFLKPQSGDVLVCDNDNVSEHGKYEGTLIGTPLFMAPEVILGKRPDQQTDLHSLAVLLFYMFFNNHPLKGRRCTKIRCFDLPAYKKLCGTDPLYIFDPRNSDNEAVGLTEDEIGEAGANALIFRKIYPRFFLDEFERAFTRGLLDREERVRESVWREQICRLRDLVFLGPENAQNFYDPANPSIPICWYSKRPAPPPIRLVATVRGEPWIIMLDIGTKVYPHHVVARDYNFATAVGEVVAHPQNQAIRGLKNLSPLRWVVTLPDGSVRDVDPGKSVTLQAGTRIQFGQAAGTGELLS